MIYETIFDGKQIPKLGFGTWRIGGNSRSDPKLDSISMAALQTALEVGYTHFDTAEVYADGHSEELIGQAIREAGMKRDFLFITTKVDPGHLKYEQVIKACDGSLQRLRMDYVDLYLIHWLRMGMKLEETFRALNKLVRDGKVKYLGVSNFNRTLLKQAQSCSETPILTDQVPYSLADRSYVENGVLDYCQQNNVLLTAYSPVKFRNLPVNQTLRAISDVHSATPYQIALAWLVAQPRVITIPMSFDPQHIRENFRSATIKLTQEEFKSLSELW
jgi:diketogulonate reductase-like aldo/keto reductase